MVRSADLRPGTKVCYRDGSIVVLQRRKEPREHMSSSGRHPLPFWPGWWLEDNRGGLADFVIDGIDPMTGSSHDYGWKVVQERSGDDDG